MLKFKNSFKTIHIDTYIYIYYSFCKAFASANRNGDTNDVYIYICTTCGINWGGFRLSSPLFPSVFFLRYGGVHS